MSRCNSSIHGPACVWLLSCISRRLGTGLRSHTGLRSGTGRRAKYRVGWVGGILLVMLAVSVGCGGGATAPVDPAATSAAADGSQAASGESGSESSAGSSPTSEAGGAGRLAPNAGVVGSALPGTAVSTTSAAGTRPPGTGPRPLLIGSFNIQRFGESKSANAVVMDRLMELTYPFDVLAIQEVVSQKEAVVQNFVAKLNEKYNAQFNYVIGPFVGRTTYVERFAYVYDSRRVKVVEQPYIIADPEDKLHREPLVARFQVRDELSSRPFSFLLINLHLDPTEGIAEMDHVSGLLNKLESDYAGKEDDVLILGDFNLSPSQILTNTQFSTRPQWRTILDDRIMTNTRRTKAYDNFVYHVERTAEFLQRQGAIDLQDRFRISVEEALEISDHLPVWAAFSLDEAQPTTLASEPAAAVR